MGRQVDEFDSGDCEMRGVVLSLVVVLVATVALAEESVPKSAKCWAALNAAVAKAAKPKEVLGEDKGAYGALKMPDYSGMDAKALAAEQSRVAARYQAFMKKAKALANLKLEAKAEVTKQE